VIPETIMTALYICKDAVASSMGRSGLKGKMPGKELKNLLFITS